jgi:hypothetical protein
VLTGLTVVMSVNDYIDGTTRIASIHHKNATNWSGYNGVMHDNASFISLGLMTSDILKLGERII